MSLKLGIDMSCANALAGHRQGGVLALALFAFLPACTLTTVAPLKTGTEFLPPSPIQIPLTMGVYHPPELSGDNRVLQPTLGARFVLPVGEATERMLNEMYPTLFAKIVVVKARPPLPPSAPPVDAVLEANIEGFNANARPFVSGRNLCWAEIVYRFTVYSAGGDVLASWNVRGIGERSGSAIDGRLVADAVDLAMHDAAQRLQTSFFDVPEARRWARGLPATDVNAPSESQTTLNDPQANWAAYPGTAAAAMEFSRDAKVPSVLSAKIRVRNEGSRRLFVRPFDFSLALDDDGSAGPASASMIVAAATPAYPRVPLLGYGPGLTFGGARGFAVGNLVSTLVNLAIAAAENRQIEEVMARFRTETLLDMTLWEGKAMEFLIHFIVPPEAGKAQALTVPVIDLDTATRYLLRLPVKE